MAVHQTTTLGWRTGVGGTLLLVSDTLIGVDIADP
jgi:hypothetical protein